MRGILRLALLLAIGALIGGCNDRGPTAIGEELLTGGAVQTVEIVLEADEFLSADTAVAGFLRPGDVSFTVVARDFGGRIDAHALARFGTKPLVATYEDSAGVVQRDTTPMFVSAEVVLPVDTVLGSAGAPVRFELYRVAGSWEPDSVEWPGPERGRRVDVATFDPASKDTLLRFSVDSATVALWTDTTETDDGGAIVLAEARGVRLRAGAIRLRLGAKFTDPDTLVFESVRTVASTFVFHPPPPPSTQLRVGGVPAWRSYLRFRTDLGRRVLPDSLGLPCPATEPDCTIRFSEASLNYAALQVLPLPPPDGFQPADSVWIEARPVLEVGLAPLARSPLASGRALRCRGAPCDSVAVAADRFPLPARARVGVPITGFVAELLAAGGAGDPGSDSAEDGAGPVLALLVPRSERAMFGFGGFSSLGAAAAPRLRLIFTVATEVEVQ